MVDPSEDTKARAFLVIVPGAPLEGDANTRRKADLTATHALLTRLSSRLGGRKLQAPEDHFVLAFDDQDRAVVCAATCQTTRADARPEIKADQIQLRYGLAETRTLAEALSQVADPDQALLSPAIVEATAPNLVREIGFEPLPPRLIAGTDCRPYRLVPAQTRMVFRYLPWSTPRRRIVALTLAILIFIATWIGMAITT